MIAAQIAARVGALPGLDASVAQLARIVNDPNATVADFERVLRADPALTANLLRVANSALYAGKTRVSAVREAILRIGTRRVWEIAIAGSFGRVLPPVLRGYDMPAAVFWQHSVAVAVLAEHLARSLRVPEAPHAFTAGLLHDMGKLVIEMFLSQEQEDLVGVLDRGALALFDAEREVLGTDHGEVGMAVAEQWGLPSALGLVARWHHTPEEAPEASRDLVAVVHVADALALQLGFGVDIGDLRRRVDPAAAVRLRLAQTALDRLAADCLAEIREMGRAIPLAPGGAL